MPGQESPLAFQSQLCQRFKSLVWYCLDSDLQRSAVFYSEIYFAMNQDNHDARHLYATALFHAGQKFSALYLVHRPDNAHCNGCLEIMAKCCTALGRHRQAREALENVLRNSPHTPSTSMGPRQSQVYPDDAAICCRSGSMALKGNLPEQATASFKQALALNPLLWEAFEGLCATGLSVPEIDELFPPRIQSPRQGVSEDSHPKSFPVPSGAGLFTPDTGNAGNLFAGWRANPNGLQTFRIVHPNGLRDTPATNDSSYHPDDSFLQPPRPTRIPSSSSSSGLPQAAAAIPRPLSSADEAGPDRKKLRSTSRQRSQEQGAPSIPAKTSKTGKVLSGEDPLKKARARPALKFTNFFSSGRSQPPITTAGKSERAQLAASNGPPRRSTRLLTGSGAKQTHTVKHPPNRDRRRVHAHTRSRSVESDLDDDTGPEIVYSPSLSSVAHSPPSETSQAPSPPTGAQDQAVQDALEYEQADSYLYNIMRQVASATRALAMYDCQKCLTELEKLPHSHRQSPWILAITGRAYYEQLQYVAAERVFKSLRAAQPYRVWDMEVYSTLLWHLQRNVELSFLAQELLNIDPKSAQAWIAIGNLFSLQKERSQALTCFQRAAQMESSCAYAYTLSGHESIDDDLDKAVAFFESALRVDARHYNAWYGLGTCYLRMSKIRLAEYHYRKAVKIHPNNAVLLGCVGMALERRGDPTGALRMFEDAITLCPDNALVRYRKAKILIATKQYKDAIAELETLRETSPDESNVIFQLAKAYRLVGDEVNSARMLAVARDLSPKSANKLRKLVETVKDEEAVGDPMDEG